MELHIPTGTKYNQTLENYAEERKQGITDRCVLFKEVSVSNAELIICTRVIGGYYACVINIYFRIHMCIRKKEKKMSSVQSENEMTERNKYHTHTHTHCPRNKNTTIFENRISINVCMSF